VSVFGKPPQWGRDTQPRNGAQLNTVADQLVIQARENSPAAGMRSDRRRLGWLADTYLRPNNTGDGYGADVAGV